MTRAFEPYRVVARVHEPWAGYMVKIFKVPRFLGPLWRRTVEPFSYWAYEKIAPSLCRLFGHALHKSYSLRDQAYDEREGPWCMVCERRVKQSARDRGVRAEAVQRYLDDRRG